MINSIRQVVWQCLEGSKSETRGGRIFEVFIMTLIVLNTVAVIIGTVAAVQERYGALLDLFEVISVVIFTGEYVMRAWMCVCDPRYTSPVTGRLRFLRTPLALIDLIAILPFYLPLLGMDLRFVRIFRLVRLLRLAKLARYAASFHLFRTVFRNRREELVLSFALILLLLVITSSLMYHVENAAQPDKFPHIPAAMWWSVMTLTTVGYGDVYPVTQLGRILAAITAILGSATFAVPAGILGAGFVEELQKRKAKGHHCPHCGKQL